MASKWTKSDRRVQVEKLLRRGQREGRSLRELAKESEIPAGTLAWWAHRLRAEAGKATKRPRRGKESRAPAFVELVTPPGKEDGRSGVEIGLRCGRTLRIPADLPAERVQDLVRAVESC